MEHLNFIVLPLIAFVAFFVKAVTGFGPAIIFIGLGALILTPHELIPTSSILDMLAGATLLWLNPVQRERRFWLPLAATIVLGSILGSICLKMIPADLFRVILASAVLALGFWFALFRDWGASSMGRGSLPARWSRTDYAFTAFGGFCGGLVGISGPPIIWHFGRQLAKEAFRETLILIFLAAAIARVISYSALGLVGTDVLGYSLMSLPGLALGIYFGNKVFLKLSEKLFSKVAGIALILIGLRLLWMYVL